MEFFVVDPKQHACSDWTDKVREFLGGESMNFNESQVRSITSEMMSQRRGRKTPCFSASMVMKAD